MMNRTLIFCFDGTWNGRDDKHSTNILKIYRGLREYGQVPFYWAGPGNEDENGWFAELMGGVFGWGSNDIRDTAYETLCAAFRPGDSIVALGFSRGAAIARMFASRVGNEGVNGNKPTVQFLGCFDTVGAYLPIGPSQQGLFHDLHVSSCVEIAYHAVALDEDRKTFKPNLMNQREGINEVWFRGVHGDVGGGMPNTGLSDTALKWMVDAMLKDADVVADLTHLDLKANPDAEIGTLSGMYRRAPRRVGVKANDEWLEFGHPNIYMEGQLDGHGTGGTPE